MRIETVINAPRDLSCNARLPQSRMNFRPEPVRANRRILDAERPARAPSLRVQIVYIGEGMTGRDAFGAVLIGSSVAYFTIADHREATAQGLWAEQTAPVVRAGQGVVLPRMATAGSGLSAPPAPDDG